MTFPSTRRNEGDARCLNAKASHTFFAKSVKVTFALTWTKTPFWNFIKRNLWSSKYHADQVFNIHKDKEAADHFTRETTRQRDKFCSFVLLLVFLLFWWSILSAWNIILSTSSLYLRSAQAPIVANMLRFKKGGRCAWKILSIIQSVQITLRAYLIKKNNFLHGKI